MEKQHTITTLFTGKIMKKLLLFILILSLGSVLFAYELNADNWGPYTTFDPDHRASLLSYPVSWLKPAAILFKHDYEDSSSTYASWDQFMSGYTTSGGGYISSSTDIVVKYIPYSFPHRWSVGLEFLSYNGANPTKRTDAVINYQHQKGSVEYYHTSNKQKIYLTSGATDHNITANGLNFNYKPLDKLNILGGIDYNLIQQVDTSSRTYDIHHEFIGVNYSPWKSFTAYGKFHYWYYVNEDRQGPAMLFYPGIRYNGKILMSHFSLRISPSTVHPIFEIALKPGSFYIHAYTKARSSRLDLRQSANQYMGLKTGFKHDSKHHYLNADFEGNYDFVRTTVADSIVKNDFYGLKAHAEYRFKLKAVELYGRASYHQTVNAREGYYHPERSILSAGSEFHLKLAEGNLLLDVDLNAQYIIHDDPDNVTFNPSTLSYTLTGASDLVGDWKINMDLKARIKTFTLSANISVPLKGGENIYNYAFEGYYVSSDFSYGNAFYAGLNIEWFWWK
ncbi:MAG: hypothetical protein U9O95_07395 [Candidatus Marinimicrobia bacterium]|nr:hypothetical protein [Candidatus Neomarinimicrobiota bacterium]